MKTSKGTEIPLLKIRGNDYLEVKYRILWFREDHPNWSIETEFVYLKDKSAMAKATIKDDTGRVLSTSHKVEDAAGFPDFTEKCETSAIGRALALIGYGTQFCADELDEGERIVDSPVTKRAENVTRFPKNESISNPISSAGLIPKCIDCGLPKHQSASGHWYCKPCYKKKKL